MKFTRRAAPIGSHAARRFIKIGAHQPKVQRQTQRMLMKQRAKKPVRPR